MEATFRLKFFLDGLNFGLKIVWVERGLEAIIPPEYWPRSTENIQDVAFALFPVYEMKVKNFHSKERKRIRDRERYYRKLVPEQEFFEIHSKSGHTYRITVIDKGRGRKFHCSCPDYVFRRKRQGVYCKHIHQWLKKKEHPVADELAVQDTPIEFSVPDKWRAIVESIE